MMRSVTCTALLTILGFTIVSLYFSAQSTLDYFIEDVETLYALVAADDSLSDTKQPNVSTRTSQVDETLRLDEILAADLDIQQRPPYPLPPPLQILETYRRQHGRQALAAESSDQRAQRRYAIGLYSCPHSAGNRLHMFANHLAWAMATNRTLLVRYLDTELCHRIAGKLGLREFNCPMAGTEATCRVNLAVADWLPRLDDWPGWADEKQWHYLPRKSPQDKQSGPFAAATRSYPVVVYAILTFSNGLWASSPERRTVLGEHYYRATQLTAWGTDFFMASLIRYAVEWAPELTAVAQQQVQYRDTSRYYSIGLHSRHISATNDGCNIKRERNCLDQLLVHQNGRQCHVSVMTDRACTVDRLQEWLSAHDCTVGVANHNTGAGTLAEHGPFAGDGYFQDLAVAASATSSAVVGTISGGLRYRSSSALLVELVEFRRRLQAWANGEDATALEELAQCYLKE